VGDTYVINRSGTEIADVVLGRWFVAARRREVGVAAENLVSGVAVREWAGRWNEKKGNQ
jgi:hypothetical protein